MGEEAVREIGDVGLYGDDPSGGTYGAGPRFPVASPGGL